MFCHPHESGDPDNKNWIPDFAGITEEYFLFAVKKAQKVIYW